MPGRDGEAPTTRDDVLPAGARHCFACGDANPIGMRLNDIRREGDQVLATLHPRPEFQSYPGVLHGGLSATALDEVMGYASILLAGIWAATATMDLRYRAQVPYTAPLPLVAGLTDTRGRRVRTWSRRRSHRAAGRPPRGPGLPSPRAVRPDGLTGARTTTALSRSRDPTGHDRVSATLGIGLGTVGLAAGVGWLLLERRWNRRR
jgi:acyl-coenzyme A thioesterase PaaI-like protein